MLPSASDGAGELAPARRLGDNRQMSLTDEETRVRELLAGGLDHAKQSEIENMLSEHPSLGSKLADFALETDTAVLPLRAGGRWREPKGGAIDDGKLLGGGGMALVRQGRQLKLDRAVAIKSLRPERRSSADISRLLREARITGRIEHPNVVPVHDIVRGDDGTPQVILKLIEGHTWSSLMDDAKRVNELFGANDLLEWNLGVLMAVARALAFAHSCDVLHCDVKPRNVMVGPFGEVYLVDWGIAHELGGPDVETELCELSGTSAYMAPEQLEADSASFGPWTDTYLLGATLYHALAGEPPFHGQSIETRIEQLRQGAALPTLPEDVPAELKRIVASALDPDPKRRMASPEELRLAVEAFLQHRGALRLAERGDQARAKAAAASAAGDDGAWDHSTWDHSILAAELSYHAALEDWPGCEAAAAGSRQLAMLRIEHALARDDIPTATRVAEGQRDLPDELSQRVEAAQAQAAEQEARLSRLVKDADRGLGHRMRGIFGAAFGALWVGFWSIVAFAQPADVALLAWFSGGVLAVGVVAVIGLAPQLLSNRINRASMWVVGTGMAMTFAWCLGASWLGVETRTVLIGFLLLSAFFTSSMAALVDPWGAVSAVAFLAAFLAACRRPDWTPYVLVASHGVLLVNQLVLNFARKRRGFEQMPRVGVEKAAEARSQPTSPPPAVRP